MKLYNVCDYVTERIDSQSLTTSNYISTENMLPNKEGVTHANNIPKGNVVAYNKGDILISNIRPYFKKIWQANINGGCSSDVLCIRAKSIVYSKFLFYLLSQQSFFDYVMSGAKGCKMPRGDKQQIMQWDIELPRLNEQTIIANTLSSLDDKIELNRRINENLEQQAQALFKSWFVDFEPFKDGKFVDSELGMIPEGWSINLVKDIAIFTQGTQVPISMQYNTQKENMIRFIRIVDYTSNNTELPRFIYKTSKQTECDESDVIMVRYGNIGTIGRRLTGVIANNLFKISPSNILTKNFLYYFFKQKEIQELIVASAAGSAMPAIKHSTIGNINIIVPPKGIVTTFDLICNNYEAQILKNNQENSYLKEVRDTLLPKLMSGELKLSEVETKLDE